MARVWYIKNMQFSFYFSFQWENPNGDESGGKSRRIMFDDPDSRIRLDNSESGTLIISNANLEDSGKYVCRAENTLAVFNLICFQPGTHIFYYL